jgi:hypothetical protein
MRNKRIKPPMKTNNILQNRPTPFTEQGGHHRSIMCIVFVLLVTIMNTVSFNNRVQRYDSFSTPTILFYMDFLLLGNSDYENVGVKRYITIKKE